MTPENRDTENYSTEEFTAEDRSKLVADLAEKATTAPPVPECFIEWLRHYWLDHNEGEATERWKYTCENHWWTAAEYTRCIETILVDPPDNIADLMRKHGWITPPGDPYGKLRDPKRKNTYIKYLKKIFEEWSTILESESAKHKNPPPS
ncbi:hypothetical protein ACFV1C_30705 [Streptomyces sp. NPDC059605]|uniref:hypothetical protein n=1 Tax=unclassified Streptomyces TaxID=2593676 RepID=UPI003675A700